MTSAALSLVNSGWLYRLLGITKLSPVKSAIIFLLINIGFAIPSALLFDAWLPTPVRRGFINDFPSWGFAFLLQPTILGAFCWIQESTTNLFNGLLREGIVQNNS